MLLLYDWFQDQFKIWRCICDSKFAVGQVNRCVAVSQRDVKFL